jgi:uncharacterized OB-fold protein
MPDISMCEGKNCPIKENCYRHRAMPTPMRQAYFTTPPYDHATRTCGMFWQIEKGRKVVAVKCAVCGSTNLSQPDHEGARDCGDCGTLTFTQTHT